MPSISTGSPLHVLFFHELPDLNRQVSPLIHRLCRSLSTTLITTASPNVLSRRTRQHMTRGALPISLKLLSITHECRRYGNSLVTQSARSMPCTFIKHKNPVARGDAHVGRAGICPFACVRLDAHAFGVVQQSSILSSTLATQVVTRLLLRLHMPEPGSKNWMPSQHLSLLLC